jgi:hypothetical protein
MAYATPTDVEDRLGRPLDELQTIVAVRLGDAERLIRVRKPTLDDDITSGALDVDLVKQIEAEAVLRLIKNLDGYTSESDGNYAVQISALVASGRLTIEDHEWVLLGVSQGVFVVRPVLEFPGPTASTDPVLWDWPPGEWSP